MLRLSVLRPSEMRTLAADIAAGRRHQDFIEALRRFLFSDRIDDAATRDLITSVAAELSAHGVWKHIDPAAVFAKDVQFSVGRVHAFARGLPPGTGFRFRVDPGAQVLIERVGSKDEPDPYSGDGVFDEAVVTVTSTLADRQVKIQAPAFMRQVTLATGTVRVAAAQPSLRPRPEVVERIIAVEPQASGQ
jgi:hypothetical protein